MDWVLVIPMMALSIPIVAIITSHQRELAKIKTQKSAQVPANVEAELQALRSEVAALRDTTTRFDMSFDAAITQLENRVDRVETRQTGGAAYQSASVEAEPLTVGRGR